MAFQVVYLCRHGNRLDWEDQAWKDTAKDPSDTPLSPSGELQAKELAAYLKGVVIHRIYSSPYSRCLQTSTEIANVKGLPIFVEFSVGEWHPDVVPKTSLEEVPICNFPLVQTDFKSIASPFHPETPADLHLRAKKFVDGFEAIVKEGSTLIVCHAASKIAIVRAFLRDISVDVFPGACSLTKLVKRQNGWALEVNATSNHLSLGESRPWRFPPNIDAEVAKVINF